MCVKLLYVKLLYVKLLYVKFVCVCVEEDEEEEAEEQEAEEEPGIQNQKQEPHTKMWGNRETSERNTMLKLCWNMLKCWYGDLSSWTFKSLMFDLGSESSIIVNSWY